MQNQNQKSALGMEANVTALIGYLIGIVALILIFIEKDNKFVRFHALQSVFWSLLGTIGFIVVMIVGGIIYAIFSQISWALATLAFGITGLVYFGLSIALVGGLIYAGVKSYGGAMFKLPVVGNFAEKYV